MTLIWQHYWLDEKYTWNLTSIGGQCDDYCDDDRWRAWYSALCIIELTDDNSAYKYHIYTNYWPVCVCPLFDTRKTMTNCWYIVAVICVCFGTLPPLATCCFTTTATIILSYWWWVGWGLVCSVPGWVPLPSPFFPFLLPSLLPLLPSAPPDPSRLPATHTDSPPPSPPPPLPYTFFFVICSSLPLCLALCLALFPTYPTPPTPPSCLPP